ncbi:MAG: acyl-CoA thioesterase [Gammaproteobacteria bacterium]|nr:acyl-CoA thioesterase [Gammaproteobacteria bacterium]
MEGHTVAYSQSTIIELMVPSYANFGGKVHGGTLMSLMDKVAYVCASKHAGNYCVTVSVDNVEFLQPVEVGEVIKLMGSVNYVGRTSLVVGIKVVAENLQAGISKHTNTCYFTMVAKSADGATVEVPPLILKTHDDVRRFLSALQRKRLRMQDNEFMDKYRQDFVYDTASAELLHDQRCNVLLEAEK